MVRSSVGGEFGGGVFKLNKTFLMGCAGSRGIALAFVAQFAIQCWIAGPLAAQLDGVVTRPGGLPVEGVSVEAWSADRRVAATLTNGLGVFSFSEEIAAETVLLLLSTLGFDVEEVTILDGRTSYEIELTESPLAVEGLVVTMERATCEMGREDEEAKRLWQLARLRYDGLMDTLGVATYLAEADTIVPLSELGSLKLPSLSLSQRGSSSLLRFSWTRRIDREGYASAIRRIDARGAYDSWTYPPLEADFAPHFVDDDFGERHRFVIADDSDGWVLEYCPKNTDKPSIKGTITLARDTTFSAVDWLFDTPEPIESAGGRALFKPILPGAVQLSHLLPAEAVTWRAIPEGDYLQSYQRYEGWRVAPGDSVPLLPLRRASGGAGR
jgi:hypothetical protein